MHKRALHIRVIYVAFALLSGLAFACPWSVRAVEPDILVVYPNTEAPYDKIFLTIIDGIESNGRHDVRALQLSPEANEAQLLEELSRRDVSGVVALGTHSLNLVQQANLSAMPIVVGAILYTAEQPHYPTLMLVPSPHSVFAKTKTLLPKTKRIITVYRQGYDDWIIDQARQAAQALQLELLPIASKDAGELAKNHVKALEQAGDTDVLWVSINGKSLSWPVMQQLLIAAWDKDTKIISSHASDVKKGVLFSFMPDHQAMGVELAKVLENTVINGELGKTASLVAASALDVAANLRMADHLGLKFSSQTQREFIYVYPPPTR